MSQSKHIVEVCPNAVPCIGALRRLGHTLCFVENVRVAPVNEDTIHLAAYLMRLWDKYGLKTMNSVPPVPEITVQELKELMDTDKTPFILDVRERKEYEIANLNGHLLPLKQIADRISELEPHKNELIVVHCRSGGRSEQAVRFLIAAGFKDARNLRGGTLAWSMEIDPSMPVY